MPSAAPPELARTGTQSIQRASTILRTLMATNRLGASALEIAGQVGLERTTTHRILKCLVDEGFAAQDARTRRYYLGPLALEIAAAVGERTDLRALARPALARIAAETEDTAFLIVRQGDDSVCIDRAEGGYPVKTFVVDVGTRRPLGVGAGSLAILSALDPEQAEGVISRNASKLRKHENMTADSLRALARKARAKGHVAMDVVDLHGVRAVGVAVRTGSGEVIGALSIAAVSWRMEPARESVLIARLRKEADVIANAFLRGS